MRNLVFVVIASILFIWVGGITFNTSWSHPGRLDASGGHKNNSTGGYHYHQVEEDDAVEDVQENVPSPQSSRSPSGGC